MKLIELANRLPKGAKIKISQTYLECKEGSSNKFYRTVVVTNLNNGSSAFLVNYGSIGTYGQKSIHFDLTESQAFANERKKIAEKTRKGYVSATCPKYRSLGCVGEQNSHTFGDNLSKDELFLGHLEKALCGQEMVERVFEHGGYYAEVVSSEELELKRKQQEEAKALAEAKERERLQAIENERKATYSTAWAEWA